MNHSTEKKKKQWHCCNGWMADALLTLSRTTHVSIPVQLSRSWYEENQQLQAQEEMDHAWIQPTEVWISPETCTFCWKDKNLCCNLFTISSTNTAWQLILSSYSLKLISWSPHLERADLLYRNVFASDGFVKQVINKTQLCHKAGFFLLCCCCCCCCCYSTYLRGSYLKKEMC